MADNSGINGFTIGFLLGAVAGVAVGFFYAPRPGRETRAMLKERAGDVRERAGDVAEKVRETASEAGKKVRERMETKS